MGKLLLSKDMPFQTYLGGSHSSTATKFWSDHTSGRLDPGFPMERCLSAPEPHF